MPQRWSKGSKTERIVELRQGNGNLRELYFFRDCKLDRF